MYPPFPGRPYFLRTAVSAPSRGFAYLDTPCLFPKLFLAYNSMTESWSRKVLLPMRARADDHGLYTYRTNERGHL
jgi:hypothetical protein